MMKQYHHNGNIAASTGNVDATSAPPLVGQRDIEQDSIRNFKFQADMGNIVIDEPDKGDYQFHYEQILRLKISEKQKYTDGLQRPSSLHPSHWPNARSIADEKIHQEFLDVYTGLYASKERYVDIVKVLGSQFYGMTQKEISTAIDVKTGGTLTKMLENLMESGIIRAYPRYGRDCRLIPKI